MEELIDEIKQKFNIKNLRITDVVYNKKEQCLYLTFLSDKNVELNVRDEIIKICKQKTIQNLQVKFVKNIIDEFVIKHYIKEFLTKNFKTFATLFNFNNIEIDLTEIEHPQIKFLLTKELCQIFVNSAKLPLLNFLDEQFFANFVIAEQIVADTIDADELLNKRSKLVESAPEQAADKMLFNDVCDLIGSNKAKCALPIGQIKGEMQDINVCGTISFFKERTYKKVDKKGIEKEKKYYNFLLNDGTGKISVTVFATVANTPKMQKLCDQTKILVYGSTEIYNERLSLRVKSIALIGDYKLKKAEQKFKAIPNEYQVVFPKKYQNFTQINLLDGDEKFEPEQIDNFLLENDIVVFDLETTGLNPADEKIIEIGAVKLVKGHLTEYFSTFVNPKKPLPAKIVKITGITDSDLVDAPTIGEVIGDFYKFCKNSILMAYNSDFDTGFLHVEAKPFGYFFDNKVLDAMNLVYKSNLPVKNLKLSSALAALGLVNKGAHRAYNDAEATAELVVKLGRFLKEI